MDAEQEKNFHILRMQWESRNKTPKSLVSRLGWGPAPPWAALEGCPGTCSSLPSFACGTRPHAGWLTALANGSGGLLRGLSVFQNEAGVQGCKEDHQGRMWGVRVAPSIPQPCHGRNIVVFHTTALLHGILQHFTFPYNPSASPGRMHNNWLMGSEEGRWLGRWVYS